MRKRWTRGLLAACVLTAVWLVPVQPGLGQTSSGEVRLNAAIEQLWDGDFSGAVKNFESISRDFPNSELDAAAQVELAFVYTQVLVDPSKARQLNTQIAARFPNSIYGYVAATNSWNIALLVDRRPFADYLSGLSALVAQAGGGSLEAIRSGRRVPSRTLANLPQDTQQHILGGLYVTAAGRLARRPPPEANPQLTREALNLWSYARDAYPSIYGEELTRAIREEVIILTGSSGQAIPPDHTAPRISKFKPEGKVGARSDIVVKLNDGDFTESQINLTSLRFVVDGTEVQNAVSVFTKTARKTKIGKPFQKIKLRYSPNLPTGPHTVQVTVADLTGNVVQKSWSFKTHNGRDEKDDTSGDDRCDLDSDDGQE